MTLIERLGGIVSTYRAEMRDAVYEDPEVDEVGEEAEDHDEPYASAWEPSPATKELLGAIIVAEDGCGRHDLAVPADAPDMGLVRCPSCGVFEYEATSELYAIPGHVMVAAIVE